jgi:glycosyltransferase involved in cell wall biosynthesis
MVPQLVLCTMTTQNKQSGKVLVSIIFPAYNEVDFLQSAIKKTIQVMEDSTYTYEIVIAEDGSTDGTAELSEELAQKYPRVKHIHDEERLGRGKALNNAFKQTKADIFVYMDLDLATDIKHLKPLIDAISVEGYDFATGSRMLPQSKVERSLRRSLTSKLYNFMVRHMLGSKIHDHQCGFKAFKREPALQLIDEVSARHWFWDTEILVRAAREGYTIKEIPVEWKSGRKTKVNLFKDSYDMGKQVVKLWWQLRKE